jgi:ERCC4-type nuclease
MFIIVIDSREQTPWEFPKTSTTRGSLTTGDYSIKGLEQLVTVERKSLQDLVGCVGSGRERFKRELHRMRGYKAKAVIIEAALPQIEQGKWRGKVTPAAVLGSINSWRHRFDVEFIYTSSEKTAAAECERFLRKFYDVCEEFVDTIQKIREDKR